MGISDVLNKKLLIVASAAVLFLGLAGSVQEVDAGAPVIENVFSIDSKSPILRTINPDTGATISSVGITLAGETVNGGRGLAFNPADGKLYAFLKVSDNPGGQVGKDSFLVTLEPTTGVATLIGDTGDRFNAMAFKENTLFAVNTSGELHSMSTVDASTIFLCEVASSTGQGLASNPVDGFLYHYTFDTFERIDDTTQDPCGVTPIPLSPDPTPMLSNTALTFRTTTGEFLFAEDSSELYTLIADGKGPDFVADMDAQSRGLAIITGDIPPPPGLPPGEHVFSIDAGGFGTGAFLHKINPDTGATISTVRIVLDASFSADLFVNGGTGLAFNPLDGKLYALLKISDDPDSGGGLDRHLATINPVTGVATLVGDTEVTKIAGLTFNPGTLFGINLDDNELSTISTEDGSVTEVCDLGGDGSLAFLPTDGLLYQATFDGELKRIDDTSEVACVVTDIPLSDMSLSPTGLVFRQATNEFLLAEKSDELYTVSANPGEVTFIGDMDHQSRGLAIIVIEGPPSNVGGKGSSSYQDPNLGDVRHGQGHDNGFCHFTNCMNVDGFFNHFPETIVPQGSTQSFTVLVNCPRGANTCNHISLGGGLPDSDFYDDQWTVTIDRQSGSENWDLTVYNPFGEIDGDEVSVTVQSVGHSFVTATFNIPFLIPGSVGTHDGIGDPHENNRHLHVTVWDSNGGVSNYIFNEGVYVDDIYAYPQIETSYDEPLEYEALCLNENPNKRYTCAFDLVKEWTTKQAEEKLKQIYNEHNYEIVTYESEQN